MSTELDVPRTTNLVLIPRLTAVELEAKNQKIPKVNPDLPTEEMKSPQPQSEVHPTRKAQRTIFRDTVSSLRHARQVPEGNRDPGYHSSTIPFEHYQANQLLPIFHIGHHLQNCLTILSMFPQPPFHH